MALKVGVVIDPWDYPFNGTVVSTRRFVGALAGQVDFRLLAVPHPDQMPDHRMVAFPKLSLPGFNGVIDRMKVPLANPWSRKVNLDEALQGLDLIHMQFPFFLGYRVALAANRLRIPLLASFHVQPENLLRNLGLKSPRLTSLLYRLFIWALYERADLVLAPSLFAANQLRANGLSRPVEVLSNGVPKEFFQLQKRSAEGLFQLLSVGRLAPEKHQNTLLQAVAMSRYRDRIQLRLIGTGPLQEKLEQQARQLDLNVAIGPVDNETLRACYESADLFLHGSEIELEGMSVLEAMAAGNTVLVSNSSSSAAVELIPDPNSQFVHGDPVDLSRKIDDWLSKPDARRQEGERNRERAHDRDHGQSVDQLLAIYHRYAGQARVD